MFALWVTAGDGVTIWQWIKFFPWSRVSGCYLVSSVSLAFNHPSSVLTCLPYIWLLKQHLSWKIFWPERGEVPSESWRLLSETVKIEYLWHFTVFWYKWAFIKHLQILTLFTFFSLQRNWCYIHTKNQPGAGTRIMTSSCFLCSRLWSLATSSTAWTPRTRRVMSGSSSHGHLTNHQYVCSTFKKPSL